MPVTPPAPLVAATPLPAVANPNARTVHEFQGDDVSMVLRLLARQAGINIIVSEAVQGSVNLRVENLTPLDVIKVIVDAKGLNISQVNSVYFIKTAAEKAKEPTESGSYTFSYAKPAETLPLIASQIQSGVPPQLDVRTNTIYYRDYKSNMANIALFLESMDRPTQQVMIEARLVEVNANPKQSYGINWSGVVGGSADPKTIRYGGSDLATWDAATNMWVTKIPATGALNNLLLDGRNGTSPARLSQTSGQQLWNQLAILSIPEFTASLQLLNEDADAEFLANPRVVTANNLKADIKITRAQPVPKLNFNEQTATSVFSGFETVEYGNTLSVTPTINKDNYVTMLVKPKISNRVADQTFTFGGATVSSPIIDTRELESNVLIKSGNTLAIGGLLQDESLKTGSKVPGLGDIPILGYVFQQRSNARSKRNLLVFITPTIIQQGYGTGLEDQVSGLKNAGAEYADPNGWRNNAKGAIRLVPTSTRPNVADYPKPGMAPSPVKASSSVKKTAPKFKVTVPEREQ